jgi:hypothetical protein
MAIYLYNESFLFGPRLKQAVKGFLGKGARGPEVVFKSLSIGLKELGEEFFVNSKISSPIGTTCILSGVKTLEWAIYQKQKGNTKKIVAGPNIVINPEDSGAIIKNPSIDIILVPSLWVKDFYKREAPELAAKLRVWAAGVSNEGGLADPRGAITIYYKTGPLNLVEQVGLLGKKHNLNATEVYYGKFSREEYVNLLKSSRIMVYISESESQGLALHEAWMAGVPALVWDRGFFEHNGKKFEAPGISAPYLTPQCGLFFKGEQDLEKQLKYMLDNYQTFRPREYSLQNFTNKICAEKYLEVVSKL